MITADTVRSMPHAVLVHVRQDLTEVVRNQEAMRRVGHRCPKLGLYNDQLLTVAGELKTRRDRRKAARRTL